MTKQKQYKIVEVKTQKDIERAEKLQKQGWRVIMVATASDKLIMEKN